MNESDSVRSCHQWFIDIQLRQDALSARKLRIVAASGGKKRFYDTLNNFDTVRVWQTDGWTEVECRAIAAVRQATKREIAPVHIEKIWFC